MRRLSGYGCQKTTIHQGKNHVKKKIWHTLAKRGPAHRTPEFPDEGGPFLSSSTLLLQASFYTKVRQFQLVEGNTHSSAEEIEIAEDLLLEGELKRHEPILQKKSKTYAGGVLTVDGALDKSITRASKSMGLPTMIRNQQW